ncbi:hypothetical protein [Paenibacillus sp. P46E]|uniref:hypothetical protein n=1 Tax=Paenibacillus sp. P46E TaxID=1349436 RepID=UPI0021163EE2|nr:hypothetical protein [Paenibacillus sp. P46E]
MSWRSSCSRQEDESSSGSSSCSAGRNGALSAFQPMDISQLSASIPAAAIPLRLNSSGNSLRRSPASASVR